MILFVLLGTALAQEHAALFVGNSYTAFNSPDNLPGAYKKLLEEGMSDWAPLLVHSHAPGGVSLEGHLQSAQGTGPLHDFLTGAGGVSAWNVVVLQDQSQIPSFPQEEAYYTASRSAAVSLAEMVVAMGGTPHLFQTWGRRDGDSQNTWRNPDFSTMQQHLVEGYDGYGAAIAAAGMEVEIIRAGEGWQKVHDDLVTSGVDPTGEDTLFMRLYANDGSHPSPLGTYLVASIAYATITGQSPVGLQWAHPGISADDRDALQAVAAAVVFGDETGPDPETDTDPESDTDSPEPGEKPVEDTVSEPSPEPRADCGCNASPRGGLVLALLAGALVWVRRGYPAQT